MCIPNLGTDSDSLFGTPCKTGLSPEITFIEAAQSQSLGCLHPRYCGLSSISFRGHVPWLENKYIEKCYLNEQCYVYLQIIKNWSSFITA